MVTDVIVIKAGGVLLGGIFLANVWPIVMCMVNAKC